MKKPTNLLQPHQIVSALLIVVYLVVYLFWQKYLIRAMGPIVSYEALRQWFVGHPQHSQALGLGLFLIATGFLTYGLSKFIHVNVNLTSFTLNLFSGLFGSEALVGDLEERYEIIRHKQGKFQANRWYTTQIVTSLPSLIWAAMKKPLAALVRKIGS